MSSFQLNISIDGSYPPIIRTVAIPVNASFNDLNSTIQSVFGWSDAHEHVFRSGGMKIGPRGHGDAVDEDTVPLSEHIGREITYIYDMKDGWNVTITWDVDRMDIDLPWSLLLGWSEESPPESCGNISGFYIMLDAAEDPRNDLYGKAIKMCENLYFDEDGVTSGLECWPTQGVRPEGSEILPQGVRMAIMGNILAFHREPMVYDIDDLEVRVVMDRAPRGVKVKRRDNGPRTVSAASVSIEPGRYLPLSPPGIVNMASFMNGYSTEYPELELPHVEPEQGSIDGFMKKIAEKEMGAHFDRYVFDRASLFPFEWARNHGYYFKDCHDVELGSAMDMARMIQESGEDVDDPEVVDRLIERYMEDRRSL